MKKSLSKSFLFLVLISVLGSCKQEQHQPEPELAQTVFYEVFPALLDSIFDDRRVIPPALPPPPEYYKDSPYKTFENWMKSNEFKNITRDWGKMRDSIHKDTTAIYIAIQDSVWSYDEDGKKEFIEHFNIEPARSDSIYLSKKSKLDLSKLIANNKKYKFRLMSEFPKGRMFWRTEYDFHLAGFIGFSKIQFDETRTYGFLNLTTSFRSLNANGFLVFIRRGENGNWIIDKIEETWIS